MEFVGFDTIDSEEVAVFSEVGRDRFLMSQHTLEQRRINLILGDADAMREVIREQLAEGHVIAIAANMKFPRSPVRAEARRHDPVIVELRERNRWTPMERSNKPLCFDYWNSGAPDPR